MFNGLFMTLGCVIPSIVIIVVYLVQKRKNNISSGLFIAMLFTFVILTATEIGSSFAFYKKLDILCVVLLRIHWISVQVLLCEITLYAYMYFNNYGNANFVELFKTKKFIRYYLYLLGLIFIAQWFFDFDYVFNGKMSFIPGSPAYLSFLSVLFSLGYYFYILIKSISNKVGKSFIVITTIYLGLYFLIQFLFRSIALDVITFAFIIMLIYILRENPDIYLNDELKLYQEEINKINNSFAMTITNVKSDVKKNLDNIIEISSEYIDGSKVKKTSYMIDVESIFELANCMSSELNNNFVSLSTSNNITEVDMHDLIARFYKVSKIKAKRNDVDFIFTIGDNVASKVNCNEEALFYLMISMFNAALNDTKVGTIMMRLDGDDFQENYHLKINIEDTGNGKTTEEYQKLVEYLNSNINYKKVDNNYIMMKKHIDKLDGSFSFIGDKYVGTTLSVDLYLDRNSTKNEPSLTLGATSYTLADPITSYPGESVLVISSNNKDIAAFKSIFSLYHFKVKGANSIDNAYKLIKNGEVYDYILVDTYMNSFEGYDFAKGFKRLTTRYGYPDAKVIAILPYHSTKRVNQAIESEFDYYIQSPVNIDEINDIILDIKKNS